MSKSNTCNSAKVQVFLYTKTCSMHEQEIDRKIGGDFWISNGNSHLVKTKVYYNFQHDMFEVSILQCRVWGLIISLTNFIFTLLDVWVVLILWLVFERDCPLCNFPFWYGTFACSLWTVLLGTKSLSQSSGLHCNRLRQIGRCTSFILFKLLISGMVVSLQQATWEFSGSV
jgi:hypothetical protein